MNRKHSTSNSQLPTSKFSEAWSEIVGRSMFDVRCFRGEMVHGPNALTKDRGDYPGNQRHPQPGIADGVCGFPTRHCFS